MQFKCNLKRPKDIYHLKKGSKDWWCLLLEVLIICIEGPASTCRRRQCYRPHLDLDINKWARRCWNFLEGQPLLDLLGLVQDLLQTFFCCCLHTNLPIPWAMVVGPPRRHGKAPLATQQDLRKPKGDASVGVFEGETRPFPSDKKGLRVWFLSILALNKLDHDVGMWSVDLFGSIYK